MTPRDLGLWVDNWRHQQWSAVEQAVEAFSVGKRFVSYALQTGSGKSLVGMAVARILQEAGEIKGRTVALTAFKGLQDQYLYDAKNIGMVDIRGKGNYRCKEFGVTCEEAWPLCGGQRENLTCADSDGGGYKAAYHSALGSRLVVTNYDYWCRVPTLAEGTDLLILDEAHEADSAVCDALKVSVSDTTLRHLGGNDCKFPWPTGKNIKPGWEMEVLPRLLYVVRELVAELTQRVKLGGAVLIGVGQKLAQAQRLEAGLSGVRNDSNWVAWSGESAVGRWVKYEPVWAGRYAEGVLFQNVPRVLMMSGTLKPKVLGLLGIKKDAGNVEYKEWGPVFKWSKCPVIWVKGGMMKYNAPRSEFDKVCRLTEEMVKTRAVESDRPGLVQTVSYDRTSEYVGVSKYRELMITHGVGGTWEAVEKYKEEVRKGRAVVLVSPSIGTGYDFADGLARWQVLMKVPFVSTQDPVMKARCDNDKGYAMHLTMTELAQMCGRICRNERDWGETVVMDNNIGWFMRSYAGLAPKGFKVAGPREGLPEVVPEGGR